MDAPEDTYWVQVGGSRRMHPYGWHKTLNGPFTELVSSETGEGNAFKRCVIITNGRYEVWVQACAEDSYGYPLRDEERVSDAEFEAITLKLDAKRDGTSVSVAEAQAMLETGAPEQLRHALIALYYASKADSSVSAADVSKLRDIVHEQTGHVDTSHLPTVTAILDEVLGNQDDPEAA